MTDPLSLLRDFNRQCKPIEEKDGKYIVFGEFTYLKTTKTNFRIQGSQSSDTGSWEYYTLETLIHFLKNKDLFHPDYCKKAAEDNVRAVRRPNRKQLLNYLQGTDNNIPKSIDTSARLETHTRTSDIKRTSEERIESPTSAKKARVDGPSTTQQELKNGIATQDKSQVSTNNPNLKQDLLKAQSKTKES